MQIVCAVYMLCADLIIGTVPLICIHIKQNAVYFKYSIHSGDSCAVRRVQVLVCLHLRQDYSNEGRGRGCRHDRSVLIAIYTILILSVCVCFIIFFKERSSRPP